MLSKYMEKLRPSSIMDFLDDVSPSIRLQINKFGPGLYLAAYYADIFLLFEKKITQTQYFILSGVITAFTALGFYSLTRPAKTQSQNKDLENIITKSHIKEIPKEEIKLAS